jgi:hypothetical protein
VTISICETNPATGQCLAPPSSSIPTQIGTNATHPVLDHAHALGSAVPLQRPGLYGKIAAAPCHDGGEAYSI